MPVIRDETRVSVRPGGIVEPRVGGRAQSGRGGGSGIGVPRTRSTNLESSAVSAAAEARGRQARAFASIAGELGALGAGLEREKAIDLAQNAEIEFDENGVPSLNPNIGDELSIAARQVFDATLDERYDGILQLDIKNRLSGIMSTYPENREAFEVAVQAEMEGLYDSIPPTFQGRAMDHIHRYTTSMGADIGWRQAQSARSAEVNEFTAVVQSMADDVFSLARAGQVGEAEALIAQVATRGADINRRNPTGLPAHTMERYLRGVYVRYGQGHVQKLVNDDERPALEVYKEWYDHFNDHTDTALGIVPDKAGRNEVRVWLASKLREQQAIQRQVQEQQEQANNIEQVMLGYMPRTEKNRKLVDQGLGNRYAQGQALTPDFWQGDFWNAANGHQHRQFWEDTARSGQIPESLVMSFRAYGNYNDTGKETLLRHWRVLKDGMTPGGVEVQLQNPLSHIPEEIDSVFAVTDILLQEGLVQSVPAAFDAAENMELGNLGPVIHGRALEEGLNDGRLFKEPSRAKQDLKTYVTERMLTEGSDTWTEGADVAQNSGRVALVMRNLIAHGKGVEESYDLAIEAYNTRHPETGAMFNPRTGGPMARSADAPEMWYAVDEFTPFSAFDTDLISDVLMGTNLYDNWYELEINRALNREGVTWEDLGISEYDRMSNLDLLLKAAEVAIPTGSILSELSEHISGVPGAEPEDTDIFKQGEHYWLVKAPGGARNAQPTYHVYLINQDHPLPQRLNTAQGNPFILDLRGPHREELTRRYNEQFENPRLQPFDVDEERLNDALENGPPYAPRYEPPGQHMFERTP